MTKKSMALTALGAGLLVCWLSGLAVAQDITTGLVGRWKLDEGAGGQGTVIVDSSPTANNGTISGTGTPTWIADNRGGTALQVTGINAYVEIPNHAAYNFGTGNYSMAVWVKGPFIQEPLCKDTSAGSGNGLYLDNDGVNYSYWNGAGAYNFTPLATDTGWHHLVAVRSGLGGGQVQLYSDNVAGTTGTDGRTLSNTTPLRIFSCSGDTATITGAIGRVDLFNRILTGADVDKLYNETDGAAAPLRRRRPITFD